MAPGCPRFCNVIGNRHCAQDEPIGAEIVHETDKTDPLRSEIIFLIVKVVSRDISTCYHVCNIGFRLQQMYSHINTYIMDTKHDKVSTEEILWKIIQI